MAILALLCDSVSDKSVPVLAMQEIETQKIKQIGRNTNLRKYREILQTL